MNVIMPSENNKNGTAATLENNHHMNGGGGADEMRRNGGDESQNRKNLDAKNANTVNNTNGCTKSIPSFDPTDYVQRVRVTKPISAKPAADPLQFIKAKPCPLYQSAQEYQKKVEEVKKIKEVKKEEPEDWQSNLDNWKSSRRKRQEHIIERVGEVKKFETDDNERMRRKSKTFSEMLEERGARGKISLPVYSEDEALDLSDLGIGNCSASEKSSISEDTDNNSMMKDSHDNSLVSSMSNSRENLLSSSSMDSEYTYENAIEDYKTRVYRTPAPLTEKFTAKIQQHQQFSERAATITSVTLKNENKSSSIAAATATKSLPNNNILKTQESLLSNNKETNGIEKNNKVVPKIAIKQKKELFESQQQPQQQLQSPRPIIGKKPKPDQKLKLSEDFEFSKTIKDRLSSLEMKDVVDDKAEPKQQHQQQHHKTPEKVVMKLKDRVSSFERSASSNSEKSASPKIDVPIISLKDRLSSLHSNAVIYDDATATPSTTAVSTPAKVAVAAAATTISSPPSGPPKIVETKEKNLINSNGPTQNYKSDDRCVILEFNGYNKPKNVETSLSPLSSPIKETAPTVTSMAKIEKTTSVKIVESANIVKEQEPPKVVVAVETSVVSESAPLVNGGGSHASEDVVLLDNHIENGADDQEISVLEALDIAFEAIDEEEHKNNSGYEINAEEEDNIIYEDVLEFDQNQNVQIKDEKLAADDVAKQQPSLEIADEPYYQVPKSCEPYYETPKPPKPVPLYENVDLYFTTGNRLVSISKEPPKEKPPPPPADLLEDDATTTAAGSRSSNEEYFRRKNSTHRIKNEIRNQRTSFLGLADTGNNNYLEVYIPPPPDMAQILREERKNEKQMYQKAGIYDSSETGDSRDSGVSENHSRQSSELFTSSEELEDNNCHVNHQAPPIDEEIRMKCIEDQIREQEEVLRVERELLQLEKEELKRQRDNLILRENLARREMNQSFESTPPAVPQPPAEHLNSNNNNNIYDAYTIQTKFRQSMPDLQNFQITELKKNPPSPPAKPMRSQFVANGSTTPVRPSAAHLLESYVSPDNNHQHRRSTVVINNNNIYANEPPSPHFDDVVLRNHHNSHNHQHFKSTENITKHALHSLSAVQKPKYTDVWVQQYQQHQKYFDQTQNGKSPKVYNNKHWLIQEAEQRRIDQHRTNFNRHSMSDAIIQSSSSPDSIHNKSGNTSAGSSHNLSSSSNSNSNNKPLPDSVIQTLTQRVYNRGLGERKSLSSGLKGSGVGINGGGGEGLLSQNQQENILSVSGKKKCSHCKDELGRGAAMIIESLRLFFHIECFKCSVCHVRLGDGLNGTDVRVRNFKLHCQNCYSSDDGVKFSCV